MTAPTPAPPPPHEQALPMRQDTPGFLCPDCRRPLDLGPEGCDCPCGAHHPVVGGIPRFVSPDNYASSFGLQWNAFRLAQLDSHTGLSISRDRLTRLFGGSLEPLRGRQVLEAGCGAGRFTEVMLDAGARVMAVDLSCAVEANKANCGHRRGYAVCQADIGRLPFAPGSFDVVVCVGVVQHTPDPERTLEALCAQVRPGGLLVFDHYTHGYGMTPSRTALRRWLLRRRAGFRLGFCLGLARALWPLHRLLWALRGIPGLGRLRAAFLWLSPVVDYHDHYGSLGPGLLRQWAILDTHDLLTDRYKHLRGQDELEATLRRCGMAAIRTWLGGNGVEAFARRPG